MKMLAHFFRFNWKMLISSIGLFITLWQFYTAIILIQSEFKYTKMFLSRESSALENSILKKDLGELKRIMWSMKGSYTEKLVYIPIDETDFYVDEIAIGDFTSKPIWAITKTLSIENSGTKLGKLALQINILNLIYSSILENFPLYLIVAVFFLLIVFIANYEVLKNLVFVKETFGLTSVNIGLDDNTNLEKFLSGRIEEAKHNGIGLEFTNIVKSYLKTLKENMKIDQEIQASEAKYKLARQFAHDVKSPVHTLKVMASRIGTKGSKELSLFEAALNRITDSANSVLMQDRLTNAKSQQKEVRDIKPLIEKIVEMKKIEFSGEKEIKIFFVDNTGMAQAITDIPTESLFNVLSNTINNSFDAIDEKGEIKVCLSTDPNKILLEIKDNGKGVSKEVHNRIWEMGFSHGKRQGNGLGLGQAKNIVEKVWKGSCECYLPKNGGTTIKYGIPQANTLSL